MELTNARASVNCLLLLATANKVQWGILALSGALLAASGRAQTGSALPEEELTAIAQSETTAIAEGRAPQRIRVAVAPVKALMTPTAHQGLNLDEPLRGLLMSQLTGPVEVMPLTESAPEKNCDYVLYTSITRQARANGARGFLRGASQMPIPMVGAGRGMAGAPASVTAGALLSGAGEAARLVKAHDVISLEYHLIAKETATEILAGSMHAKATEDGQDVITPLMQREALAVLNTIRENASVH